MMPGRERHRLLFLLIATGAFGAALSGADVGSGWQIVVLVAGVALLGIPHGALDPVVAIGAGLARDGRSMTKLLVVYIALGLLTLALWRLGPTVAFIGFLLMSTYHFAGDWGGGELSVLNSLAVSSVILCGPALFWPEQTLDIYAVLVPEASAETLVNASALIALPSVGAAVWIAASKMSNAPLLAFELLALPVLAWKLTPLMFFVVYFCALHSPRHLLETVAKYGANTRLSWQVGVSLTMLTLLLAAFAYATLPSVAVDDRTLRIVFIGLSALTVPHMWLLQRAGKLDARSSVYGAA